ncbi:hypothetical protein BS78_K058100, partial [Paspalum vaginatum]
STSTAPPPPLPPDVLLEIVARSDAVTLIRCAACCKLLRRDILSPAFIRRVCSHGAGGAAIVPPRLFGILPSHDPFRAAEYRANFSEMHLAPLLSRGGGDPRACFYDPFTSRNGLVALKLRPTNSRRRKSGICVYDPMAGDRTLVPDPPGATNSPPYYQAYVLLTASDGIGCSFLLLMADFAGLMDASCSIKVQSVSSDDAGGRGKWSPATSVSCDRSQGSYRRHSSCSAVVLDGCIHWLMVRSGDIRSDDYLHVLTYKVGAATAGRIELPMDRLPKSYYGDGGVRLGSTPDGRLTMLFRETQGLKISVWLRLSADAGWAPHVVIDVETPLRSLM